MLLYPINILAYSAMQCLKRTFLPVFNTNLSQYEISKLPENMELINKQYLAQRKTVLSIVMFFYILTNTNLVYLCTQLQMNDDITKIVGSIIILLTVLSLVSTIMVCAARYHWNNYKISSWFVIAMYFTIVIAPIAVLFVPYNQLLSSDSIVENFFTNMKVTSTIAELTYGMVVPSVMMIQNILSCSRSLANIYDKTKEFKIAIFIMIIVYLPIFLIVIGVAYQADAMIQFFMNGEFSYDILIIIFMFTYMFHMFAPIFIKGSWQQLAQLCTGIPLIIIAYTISLKYDVSLIQLFIRSFIASLFTNAFVSDSLITIVTSFNTPAINVNTPHNLYVVDNTREYIDLQVINNV